MSGDGRCGRSRLSSSSGKRSATSTIPFIMVWSAGERAGEKAERRGFAPGPSDCAHARRSRVRQISLSSSLRPSMPVQASVQAAAS
jgi:hypothetical protein